MEAAVQVALDMDDGSLTIYTFATRSRSPTPPHGAVWVEDGIWERLPTQENLVVEFAKAFPGVNQAGIRRPRPVSFRLIDPNTKPDRSYRNAWKFEAGLVVEDLAKAKEIHRDRLKNQSVAALVGFDIEWSRAMAVNDRRTADEIEAKRQVLRDAPNDPRINAATTIAELRQITLPVV